MLPLNVRYSGNSRYFGGDENQTHLLAFLMRGPAILYSSIVKGIHVAIDSGPSIATKNRELLLGCCIGCAFGCFVFSMSSFFGSRSRHKLIQIDSDQNISDLHHMDEKAFRNKSANGVIGKEKGGLMSWFSSLGARSNSRPSVAQIFQVVLTGGPCAGKSSSMKSLAEKLGKQGFDVYVVPEVPTLLLNGGCVYPGIHGGEALVTFEASLVELQLQMERTFFNIASSTGNQSVILYDRGLLDVAAYMPRSFWPRVLNYNSWVRAGMLGVLERYDLVIHLVTSADGAEKSFLSSRLGNHSDDSDQNAAMKLAKELDQKILESYRGHPHHHVVDNSVDFPRKLERAFQHVERMIKGKMATR